MSPRLVLLALVPILASGCVSNSGSRYGSSRPVSASRYGTPPPATIWERVTQQVAQNHADALAPRAGRYTPPAGSYRVYTGVSGIPDTTRLYAPPSGLYSRQDDYAASDRYGSREVDETRRLTGPQFSSDRLQPRAEYAPVDRSPLPEARIASRRPLSTSGTSSIADRLASAGSGRSTASAPPQSSQRQRPDAEDSSPKASSPSSLPYARPLAGKTGYVQLPSRPELPEIDVRGIAPGTPVEVPDPTQPGQTIQFRVP